MTSLSSSYVGQFGRTFQPTSFSLRIGRRELSIRRDFRPRYHALNPLLDVGVGVAPGHIEFLFFRRWAVVMSKALEY